MNKKKLGLTMLSTAIIAGGFLSSSNTSLAIYLDNSVNKEPTKEIVCTPNIDSLQQVIASDSFVWNDSTYTEYKDLITDTVFGGYSKNNKKYNQFHVLQKNGKEVTAEIDSIGRKEFADLLDQHVGRGGSLNDLFENLQAYNTLYAKIARKNNINRRLLLAVGIKESYFNPYAISHADCLGLNQLHPSVYQENNPFDIKTNVETSAQLLSFLLRQYKGNDTLALTAYNRGRSGLNKVIQKANEAGIVDAQGIINYKENGNYLLSKEAREYAQKTLMYKELIRQYQPHEGEKKFLARLTTLKNNLEN